MKRITVFLLFALLSVIPMAADNPYEIDEACYQLMMKAEGAINTPEFAALNEQFRNLSRQKGDKKAETLSYVLEMRDLTRRPSSPENDRAVDEAQQRLMASARQNGYSQYDYFAYQLAINYYHNKGQAVRMVALANEMREKALAEHSEYGLWQGDSYLAKLYIAQNDYLTAKEYILRAIQTWETTDDPTILRQPVTRLYTDLSDCYPVGSDSVRINVEKAFSHSSRIVDTTLCYYYFARICAVALDRTGYGKYRDYCLKDSRLNVVGLDRLLMDLIDAAFDGTILHRQADIRRLRFTREVKVLANVCENLGYKDLAFSMEKQVVNRVETLLSASNHSRLAELDVALGKAAVTADLQSKNEQVSRFRTVAFLLLLFLLAAALAFSWLYIRNLKRTNTKVRLANETKTRFVQNMSHEIRTPLNAIVGFSQLLSLPDGSFPEEEKNEFSDHILNNTKMLTMLLDDILSTSAMDSGNYPITYEDGECHSICTESISSAEHRLQPGVRMYYAPESPEPYVFRTDPRRVQQVLVNLLTNACKYTLSGEIRLSSSLTEHPGNVTFAVTDTGPGVPEEDAEKIFERFTQLNDFHQGTGLGLSICRDIAGRMGGRVYLDTSYKAGARFVFTVPVKPIE